MNLHRKINLNVSGFIKIQKRSIVTARDMTEWTVSCQKTQGMVLRVTGSKPVVFDPL